MENYNNILKDISYVRELRGIKIEDNDVLLTVLTTDNEDNVLSLSNLLFTNPELAENVINDTVTLILKDFGNIRDIKESIKILSEDNEEEENGEDEEDNKFLFRDERLEFIFVILFGDKNISIFDSESGRCIITSEYTLDMARIAMMNIFLSSFRLDASHIFFDRSYRDFATPIFSAIDYNLIMDDFITYFYKLEGFISKDNITDLIGPFVKSGWTRAVKFILERTPDEIVENDGSSIIPIKGHRVVYDIISDMVESNDQEMFDFIFDEYMPEYGYNNETNYIDLATLIIKDGTVEQFEYLVYKLPIEIDLANRNSSYGSHSLFFEAIVREKTDIAEYMILNYNVDPNEKVKIHEWDEPDEDEEEQQQYPIEKSYIRLSLEWKRIEIFKLLISKDGLIISGEDRELIESRAEYNEEIRVAYEEYLKRNGLEYAINNFDPNKGYFTIM